MQLLHNKFYYYKFFCNFTYIRIHNYQIIMNANKILSYLLKNDANASALY